ncbi:MAG TPA: hypothetical protein VI168_00115 [Croceibacterium sp.]
MIARRLAIPLLLAAMIVPHVAAAQATPAEAQPTAAGIRWSKEVPVIRSGAWNGPLLADGQPDISGFWSNTISNHSNFTDPQAGPPGEPSGAASLPRGQRAPSRVSDPADGQIPYRPEARALQEDFARNFANPTEPQYIEPLARCAPAGSPKSFMWHGFEIRQYPGYVLFLFDSGSRIVRLDDRSPRLADSVKLWNGDSRGHWEGNTLVVSVRNNNGKALFGRYGDFMSAEGTVEERYVFDADGKRFNYLATFTDPTVYTRPWTATIPVRRYTDADEVDGWHFDVTPANLPGGQRHYEHHERICVENNGPFGGGAIGVPLDHPVIAR